MRPRASAEAAPKPVSEPVDIQTDPGRDPAFLREPVRLTESLPGIGGRMRVRDEDFLVDEQPLYQPCGEGEHCYMLIEKRGLATNQLVSIVARHFGVKRHAVGVAGMKDKRAITRQVVSVHTPGKSIDDFPMLTHEHATVLWADMHTNKLRLGHLKGNRFSVKVRDVQMTDVLRARAIMEQLAERGVPNFFGPQRFGSRQNNHELGRHLIADDPDALLREMLGPDAANPELNREARELYEQGRFEDALRLFPRGCNAERSALAGLHRGAQAGTIVKKLDTGQKRFWFSAFQSALFNRVLRQRVADGTFDRLLEGDIAETFPNGGIFRVDEEVLAKDETQPRLEGKEIGPTGPMWGAKMDMPKGEPGILERQTLEGAGVTREQLDSAGRSLGPSMLGARRALRVPLIDPEIEGGIDEHGHYVRCAFELPSGSFATVVMGEVMKAQGDPRDE